MYFSLAYLMHLRDQQAAPPPVKDESNLTLTRFERFLVWLGFKYLDIKKTIDGKESVYLRRFYIIRGGEKYNLFLHHFFRSDDDPDPHDHPWAFWTLPLTGGYTDERYSTSLSWTKPHVRRCGPYTEKVRMLVPKFRTADHIHRVIIKRPIWTLVLGLKTTREWGFVKKDGWVHWREYLNITDPNYNPDKPSES